MTYVFDGYIHPRIDQFTYFLAEKLGTPSAILPCQCEKASVIARLKKKLEIEEVGEEQQEELQLQENAFNENLFYLSQNYQTKIEQGGLRFINIGTEASEETLSLELKELFAPKVILVNHEKRLTVDTTCANLAIKYNFLYISVYQAIKQHIETNTELGKRLLATKKSKDIRL